MFRPGDKQQKRSSGRPTDDPDTAGNIMRTAAQLFADYGIDGVTVREIANACGITMPTLYYHFTNKLELYRQVVLFQQGATASELYEALQPVETIDDMFGWLKTLVETVFRNREFHRIVFREMFREDIELHQMMAQGPMEPLYNLLRDKLNKFNAGSGDGPLPLILMSSALGYFTLRPFGLLMVNNIEVDQRLPGDREISSVARSLLAMVAC